MWKRNWSEVFDNLALNKIVYSNDFIRQDYILAVFDGDKCAALILLRKIDLKCPTSFADSWFGEGWVKSDFEAFEHYKHCYIFSSYTVDKGYRKNESARKVSGHQTLAQMLGCVANLFLLEHTDFELGFGTLNNARKMPELCKYFGSRTIRKEANYLKAPADLVYFTRKTIEEAKLNWHIDVIKLYSTFNRGE